MSILLVVVALVASVHGHGYIQDPPGRNAMWKYGFKDAPANYNMNENFCGGVGVQYAKNGGKCGICGDPYNEKKPRRHEVGGSMYDGRIVRTYKSGEEVEMKIHLTANHKGWFQFKLCPTDPKPTEEVTQECLDKTVLLAGGKTKYNVKSGIYNFKVKVQLPQGLKCERCVLQWKYHAGNSWGCDKRGDWRSCGLGRGKQEEFVNCSDIKIE